MRIVAQHECVRCKLPFDRLELRHLVFSHVQTVVDEHVYGLSHSSQGNNRVAEDPVRNLCELALDQVARLLVDVNGEETAVAVPEQGGSDHTTSQALVRAGFHDSIGLHLSDQGVPTETPGQVNRVIRETMSIAAYGGSQDLSFERPVCGEFFHVLSDDRWTGIDQIRDEPREVLHIQGREIVGVVRVLFGRCQPAQGLRHD